MDKIKKILFITASLFLIFLTFVRFYQVNKWGSVDFLDSLSLAAIANLYITGIFAFAGFALPTYQLLPAKYYEIQDLKRLKSIYGILGVEKFRKLLLATIWSKRFQRKNYFNGRKSGLTNFENETKQDEFGHLLAFVSLLLASIYFLMLKQFWLSFFTALINIPFNFYPIILQRYHRMRLNRLRKFAEN